MAFPYRFCSSMAWVLAALLSVLHSQAQSRTSIPPVAACRNAVVQIEVREANGAPIQHLVPSALKFTLAGKTVEPLSVTGLDLSPHEPHDVWLLVLFWPGIDIQQKELDELVRELRRPEAVRWHIAAIAPGTIGVNWLMEPDAQVRALNEAYASAKAEQAFRIEMRQPFHPQPGYQAEDKKVEEPFRQLWTAKVSFATRELESMAYRKLVLEIAPRPDPSLLNWFPGEQSLYSLARNGNVPVYRVIQIKVDLVTATAIPFGDASTGAPLVPEAALPSSGTQIGQEQLRNIQAGSEIQGTHWSRHLWLPQTGGEDFATTGWAVKKMVEDLGGGYQITLAPPTLCKPGVLYPFAVEPAERKQKMTLFAPAWVLAQRSYGP